MKISILYYLIVKMSTVINDKRVLTYSSADRYTGYTTTMNIISMSDECIIIAFKACMREFLKSKGFSYLTGIDDANIIIHTRGEDVIYLCSGCCNHPTLDPYESIFDKGFVNGYASIYAGDNPRFNICDIPRKYDALSLHERLDLQRQLVESESTADLSNDSTPTDGSIRINGGVFQGYTIEIPESFQVGNDGSDLLKIVKFSMYLDLIKCGMRSLANTALAIDLTIPLDHSSSYVKKSIVISTHGIEEVSRTRRWYLEGYTQGVNISLEDSI
jgi:hypothetical protein